MRESEMVGPKAGLLRLAAVALSPAYFRQRFPWTALRRFSDIASSALGTLDPADRGVRQIRAD